MQRVYCLNQRLSPWRTGFRQQVTINDSSSLHATSCKHNYVYKLVNFIRSSWIRWINNTQGSTNNEYLFCRKDGLICVQMKYGTVVCFLFGNTGSYRSRNRTNTIVVTDVVGCWTGVVRCWSGVSETPARVYGCRVWCMRRNSYLICQWPALLNYYSYSYLNRSILTSTRLCNNHIYR